jgi:hypothetical protein
MRYFIDEGEIDEATALALYRAILRWAAARADRFVLGLQRNIYDDPDELARLLSLGVSGSAPGSGVPPDLVDRIRQKLFKGSSKAVQIEGTPNEELIRALTERAAPPLAVAGDLSPVEDILLLKGKRAFYALYDYGRTQMLDLDNHELESLRQTIQQAGFDPAIVAVAPPRIIGET